MLICPVRDCRLPLLREARQWRCEKGHSFDIARSGYVNLLQPQERRSKQPGDAAEAVAARRRLHDRGLTAPLKDAIANLATPQQTDTVLDAGCGDGYYLGSLAAQHHFQAHGVDISIPAIDAAARRYPHCHWLVANADRAIPFADASFSVILSITARMNPPEFRRLLKPDGRLLVAIPAAEDLIEVRGAGKDRVARTVEEFRPHFQLIEHRHATTTADLDADAVADIRLSIYRPMQAAPPTAARVTFAFDLLLFRPADC